MPENPYFYTLLWVCVTVVFIVLASLGVGGLARLVVRLFGGSKIKQGNTAVGFTFASPWIVGFLIFVVAPMLASLYWSFTNYKIPNPPDVVGFNNYIRLILKDKDFLGSLVNTLFLTVIGLPLQIGVALFLAVLLNQKSRGERVFRMSFYLPVILGFNTAVLLCWRLMLTAGNGIVNQIIRGVSNTFPPLGYLNRLFVYITEI
ncbi:MAG TPA: sugar ABC transporter permease, partial [Anaerolineales bacterium]